jgi:hypothetical protein
MILFNDVFWNLPSFVFFNQVHKYDLNFRHYGHKSLLVVKYDSVSLVKLRIINFELIEIITIFNILNALFNVSRIVYLQSFCFFNV